MQVKKCVTCNEVKSLLEFSKAKKNKDGLSCECKVCVKYKRTLYRRKKGQPERPKCKILDNTKQCIDCKIFKNLNDFFTESGHKTSLRCLPCYRLYYAKQRREKGIPERRVPIILEDKRICLDCGEIKELSEFNRSKWTKVKTVPTCKKCTNLKTKLKRRALGINAKITPIIIDIGKECIQCNEIKYFEEFSDRKTGRKGKCSTCKICMVLLTEEARRTDPEFKNKCKAYWESDKGKLVKENGRKRYRKLLKDATIEKIPNNIIEDLYNTETCYFCGKYTERDKRTIEHKIALSKGGLNIIDNIVMSCLSCNSSKKAKSEKEFIEYRIKLAVARETFMKRRK
jgi:hypothetical protein